MTGDDFAVTAGWGHFGQGRSVERDVIGKEAVPALGNTTYDIYLNGEAFWRNVPEPVWNYRLGGYQVLKKWLSYRERDILGRRLRPEEVQHFTDTARRVAAILLLTRAGIGQSGPVES